uniref:Partner of Y14 and mago n=1 Tax=Lygus hesperus TaxID=30085 RepID=A0A0A9W4B5_LYGHE
MSMVSPYVVKSEDGEQYIPASQRADGTWRKARKVKDGYIPQDEVPIYQSKGKQWAAGRSSYPVGLDPSLIREKELKEAAAAEKLYRKQKAPIKVQGAPETREPSFALPTNKTATSKEAGSKPSAAKDQPKLPKEEPFVQVSKKQSSRAKNEPKKTTPEVSSTTASVTLDPVKRLRNLKKKLKDVESLEAKIVSKELKNPDKDQLEKVRRKSILRDEILALELSLTTIT